MRTINEVLDRAKRAQKVGSDYKLGLTLGIGLSALSNYRHGRSFPDESACSKLAAAMGEKPDLLLVEIQAQRAKTIEAKALWSNLAARLQTGFASVQIMVYVAIVSLAACAAIHWVTLGFTVFSVHQFVYYVKSQLWRLALQIGKIVKVRKVLPCFALHTLPR